MRKLLNKPWFVAVLAVSAVAVVGSSLFSGKSRVSFHGGADGAATVENTEDDGGNGAPKGIAAAIAALPPISGDLRNPFAVKPRVVETGETNKTPDFVDQIHLSAIWTQAGMTYVLLNDQICRIGDEFGRFKLESASQEGVWVSHWKGRDFLKLGNDFTLNTPATQDVTVASTL